VLVKHVTLSAVKISYNIKKNTAVVVTYIEGHIPDIVLIQLNLLMMSI